MVPTLDNIKRLKLINKLNEMLLAEMPFYRDMADSFSLDMDSRRRLLRSLMNLRPPLPLNPDYLLLQDRLLGEELEERGIVNPDTLPPTAHPQIFLYRGDITRLNSHAIVNAANSGLTGCYHPCHSCIDNAIHSAAGLQLREECHKIISAQGGKEKTGTAKLTMAYNLPCSYVLHTVGPIISGPVSAAQCKELSSCYSACLDLCLRHSIKSIAFCCISTGEFRFPKKLGAKIAVDTVKEYLKHTTKEIKVIFNVFTEFDQAIYRELLCTH